MASVGRADTCNGIVGAVGVARIFGIVVFCDNIIFVFALRQIEFAFSVSHPDAQLVAAQ